MQGVPVVPSARAMSASYSPLRQYFSKAPGFTLPIAVAIIRQKRVRLTKVRAARKRKVKLSRLRAARKRKVKLARLRVVRKKSVKPTKFRVARKRIVNS